MADHKHRTTERLTAEDRKMIRGRPDVAGGGYAYLPAAMILSLLDDADELDRRPEDDPDVDCTDYAHPAWWRGNDAGVFGFARKIRRALDGEDEGSGVMTSPELQAVRRDVLAMRAVDLSRFCRELADWSQATFGADADRGPIGPLKHLEKEAREAQADPSDLTEFADCLLIVLDATRRAGFTLPQLVAAAWAKLKVNRDREWPKPTGDEPVEHVRD